MGKTIAFYACAELLDFISESLQPEWVLQYGGPGNKSKLLEHIISHYAHQLLKGQVSERQIAGVQNDPKRLLKLSVFCMRLQRKEKGYSFIPGPMNRHGDDQPTPKQIKAWLDDPVNQWVVGPKGETP